MHCLVILLVSINLLQLAGLPLIAYLRLNRNLDSGRLSPRRVEDQEPHQQGSLLLRRESSKPGTPL
jgi:hypothetical protein